MNDSIVSNAAGPNVELGPLPRHLGAVLEDALAHSRVVHLFGGRRTGKTRLVRDLMRTGRFVTLDDPETFEAIEGDPWSELHALRADIGDGPVIIDEAQRSEALSSTVRRIVDGDQRPGQFVMTGPADVFTTAHAKDSRADRVRTLTLWPLSAAEAALRGPPTILDWAISAEPRTVDLPACEALDRPAYVDLILRGGYPRIRNLELEERQAAYRRLVRAIVDEDATAVAQIRKPDAVLRLIERLAFATATEVNVEKLRAVVGVQRKTLERYLDVLQRLTLIVRLDARPSESHSRHIRKAKRHFADTGIASALRRLGPRSFQIGGDPAALGPMLESFVFAEILRSTPHQRHRFRLHHWRAPYGRKIDLVAEAENRVVAIDVKASTVVGPADFKHMDWFAAYGPGATRRTTSIIFNFGERPSSFGDRRYALPVSCLWGDAAAP